MAKSSGRSLVFAAVFLGVLVILPWGIRRYNWLNLKGIIRFE